MLCVTDPETGSSLPGKFPVSRFFDRRKFAEYKGLKAGAGCASRS